MTVTSYIKLDSGTIDRIIDFEQAMQFGVFSDTSSLEDFKKAKMADELIGLGGLESELFADKVNNKAFAMDPRFSLPIGDRDKYIIVELISTINQLTDNVNMMTGRLDLACNVINSLLDASRQAGYQPRL